MAAGTAAIGGLGLALGGIQALSGRKNMKAAQSDLSNFKRQDLVNPYENVQISTVGTDAMREQTDSTLASLIDASSGDLRSVVSAVPRVVQASNNLNRSIQTDLDEQAGRRDYAIAQDDARIRDMQERRDDLDLQGIGTRLNTGRHDYWNGLNAMGSAGMFLANNLKLSKMNPNDAAPNRTIEMVPRVGSNNTVSYEMKPNLNIPKRNPVDSFISDFNNNFLGF